MKMHRVLVVLQAVALLAAGCRPAPAPAGRPALAETAALSAGAPPATRKSPVVDRYHGVEVIGGPHRVRVFDLTGKPLGTLPLPPVSAVYQLIKTGGRIADAVPVPDEFV